MADFELGKIFVGGIPWDISEATLTDYFSRYGEISSTNIAKDRETGNPRGFAFVTFTDPSSVHKALGEHHEISGRTIEVERAKSRYVQQHYPQSHRESSISSAITNFNAQFRTKKIFVGGLSADITEEEFTNYFDKFGRIIDVVVLRDNVTHRSRGFGFITFDTEDVAEEITKNCFHVLNGKYVEVKKAIPKELSRHGRNGQNQNSSSSAGMNGGYWPENGHVGFYPVAGGYGGVYGTGYHMAWPRYGSVGYTGPVFAATNHWNGLGMVNYAALPNGSSSGYQTNHVFGAGPMGVYNGVDNTCVGMGKLALDGGSNHGVQDNGNGSSTPKTRQGNVSNKRNQRQRSSDRKQKPLISGDSS